jgi:hypothetical protein
MTGIEVFMALATLAGTGAAVASTIMSSNAAGQEAYNDAAIQDYQAKISMDQAEDWRKRAEFEAVNAGQEKAAAQRRALAQQEEARRTASSQRAKFAGSGIGLWGSAAHVVAETEALGEYNAEMELWQGDEKARAYAAQEVSALQQADIEEKNAVQQKFGAETSRKSAKNIRKQMWVGVVGDVAEGATKMTSSMKTAGGSGSKSSRWGT